MIFTGIVRGVDRLGRIVLPKKMRQAMDLKELTDAIEVFVSGDGIILKKYDNSVPPSGDLRCLDKFGRIVIPIEIRTLFGIVPQVDSLEIYCQNDQIILKKNKPSCVFCGGSENLTVFKEKNICEACIAELKK